MNNKNLSSGFYLVWILICLLGTNRLLAQTAPGDDFDGDGIINSIDTDDDNDGISDVAEGGGSVINTVTNSTFNTNSAGWTLENGWTRFSNALAGRNDNVTSNPRAYQTITLKNQCTSFSVYQLKVRTDNYVNSSGAIITESANLGAYLGNFRLFSVSNPTNSSQATITRDASSNSIIESFLVNGAALTSSRTINTETYYDIQITLKAQSLPETGDITFRYNSTGDDILIDDIYYYLNGCPDTDKDGIPNMFDLDTDGDGCPDAVEGAGNYTYSDLKNIQTVNSTYTGGNSGTGYTGTSTSRVYSYLGNVSDSQGAPIINGVTVQQAVGDSQNVNVNYCNDSAIDTDHDGVPDSTDIDDDNDGVLDTNEKQCVDTGKPLYENYNGTWTGKDGLSYANYHPAEGFRVAGYKDSGVEEFSFTLTGVIPGQPNTLRYRFYSLIPDNPESNTVRLYVNGVLLHQYSTVSGQTNPPSLTIDHGLKTVTFTPTANTATVKITFTTPTTSGAASDGKLAEFNLNGANAIDCNVNLDTDNDGIPNHLDLDSDNDGCSDAFEAGVIGYVSSNGGTYSSGTLNNPQNTLSPYATVGNNTASDYGSNGFYTKIESNDSSSAAYNGTYTYSNATDAAISTCNAACYKQPATSGTILETPHGITSLQRAGKTKSNWPMERKGGWMAMEAKSKGFVPNRLTTAQISAIPVSHLVEGMMVYNTDLDCLQINTNATPQGWKCFKTQACP